MRRFVTPQVVITLSVANVILIVLAVTLLVMLSDRSRFRPTQEGFLWFDTKTAQVCTAMLKPDNPLDAVTGAEPIKLDTNGKVLTSGGLHYCMDLK